MSAGFVPGRASFYSPKYICQFWPILILNLTLTLLSQLSTYYTHYSNMMKVFSGDDSLLVDISDALSERDRVRFTVHTRTKMPQFAKPTMSVVRQHEEFIWLHDCLEDNDRYAGYIIPPPPPRPDFDASREKLQRLGDSEANMTKEEFAKMKQELEAEYLAIFKKTVAMHEIFLQRLAVHEKFREDNNFKIFLEYENELAVRSKSNKERIAGSIQNIGKSLTDFVITTSQIAATNSASTSLLTGYPSPSKQHQKQQQLSNGNISSSDISGSNQTSEVTSTSTADIMQSRVSLTTNTGDGNNNQHSTNETNNINNDTTTSTTIKNNNNDNSDDADDNDDIDEQYFEKERLFLALYHNGIRETAIQANKVTQAQKAVADSYLFMAQQLVRLASVEVVPITAQTKDSTSFVACKLPSLTLPTQSKHPSSTVDTNNSASLSSEPLQSTSDRELGDDDDLLNDSGSSYSIPINDSKQRDNNSLVDSKNQLTGGCANDHTSEGLKQLLLNVADYFEQARKIETRIASDEDLKLTDTFLYYKRDTVAAQDLLMRRLRFMVEYDTASKNLEKARQKGRTQMQYADVIQKQAKENFISISKLVKQELSDYKQRRVASFRKSFSDLVELELKHLRSHSQLIVNCLNTCRGISVPAQPQVSKDASSSSSCVASSSGELSKRESDAQMKAGPATILTNASTSDSSASSVIAVTKTDSPEPTFK